MALLVALGSISKEQAEVLKVLYELRNKLAHDVKQVSFSFDAHLACITQSDRNRFIKRVSQGAESEVFGVSRECFVADNPKISLWLTLAEVLACLHLEHDRAELKLAKLALSQLTAKGDENHAP